jgi:hypothetical protein
VSGVFTSVGAPTGTIGVGGVDVLFDSECLAGGGCWPSGMTMGAAMLSPPALASPPPESESELCDGGQSTDVGGQLSPPPDPEVSPGGAQPELAPKSPAPVQSAQAMPVGATMLHPATNQAETTAAASHRRRTPPCSEDLVDALTG